MGYLSKSTEPIFFSASYSKRRSPQILFAKAIAVVFTEHGVTGTAEFSRVGDDKRRDHGTG